ncbi:hypothetical protein A176_005790 [Myxococcus hansupus]|uniref:Uncharacterized protein n=1 Tax=Pseudomyxococcus hansupus TaxID=1297742 RepID=A0A0H4X4V5_9BACT|nr:hypothetical protein A176_005790 [Myxococcus hansupus]
MGRRPPWRPAPWGDAPGGEGPRFPGLLNGGGSATDPAFPIMFHETEPPFRCM